MVEFPHVTPQEDHDVHDVQLPSTAITVILFIINIMLVFIGSNQHKRII